MDIILDREEISLKPEKKNRYAKKLCAVLFK